MVDHVTLLSPARIEGRVARDNFTPIVGRTISSGFNVFASGPRNAATESGNAGIEIVLGERFPSEARCGGPNSQAPQFHAVRSICTQGTQYGNRIGVREFRENLTGYLESGRPLASIRHRETR